MLNKKYLYNKNLINKKSYSLKEAIDLIKKMKKCNFEESLDMSIFLNNAKKKILKYNFLFPYNNKKKLNILLLTQGGDNNSLLKEKLNIKYIGGEEYIDKIKNNEIDPVILSSCTIIATFNISKKLNSINDILISKKNVPSKKCGTLTNNVKEKIKNFYNKSCLFTVKKKNMLNLSIGKICFPNEHIIKNFEYVCNIVKNVEGSNIRSVFLSKTMGPSIHISV